MGDGGDPRIRAGKIAGRSAVHTRFGVIRGSLERLPLRLAATEGAELEIEATVFVSPDWPGPTVIGWRGGLERFRLALDPWEEWFFFAALDGGGTAPQMR